jgi:hypothetical protein
MLFRSPQSPATGIEPGFNSKIPAFGGRLACAWRETDAESTDRVTLTALPLRLQSTHRLFNGALPTQRA